MAKFTTEPAGLKLTLELSQQEAEQLAGLSRTAAWSYSSAWLESLFEALADAGVGRYVAWKLNSDAIEGDEIGCELELIPGDSEEIV